MTKNRIREKLLAEKRRLKKKKMLLNLKKEIDGIEKELSDLKITRIEMGY